MYPILFELGPFKIYSYGLMVALAFIVATLLVKQEAQRQNIPAEKIFNLALGLVVSGILGARLLYILLNIGFYLEYPREIIMLHKGGLSFYGGFIFAIIWAIIFLKKEHLPILGTFDICAPYLALAQAIGRIGCFLNGCCYGKPTDSNLSVYFPGENFGRHPVQIYAALNLVLIFIILRSYQIKIREKTKFSGKVFLLYCLLYSISRFFMEFLRGDNLPVLANLTIHQLISIGIFVIAGIIFLKK